jgi:methionyl-tRNA formyltransferase
MRGSISPAPMRTIFFGSPPFARGVFAALLATSHRPLALVTPPDRPRGRGRRLEASPLADAARAAGVLVLQPQDPHAAEVLSALRDLRPEVLTVASYGKLFRRELLELAPQGALNVHASLLPRWRGAAPIQAAILHGDAETGVCVQRMVRTLDAGDVLVERRRTIGPDETAGELLEALSPLGGEALVEALDRIERGTVRFHAQDPSRVTLAPKLEASLGRIRFERAAEELGRLVRALNPWPLVRCRDAAGRELAILAARASSEACAGPPGSLRVAGERLLVATGQGALELLRVQPAGRRAMSAAEYLRGARLAEGARLQSL